MDNLATEQEINDLFDASWEPTITIDNDAPDFDTPIKGKYEAVIESIEHRKGTNKETEKDWELIGLKMKITKDIEGDTSLKRKVDKAYFLGTSEWNDDPLQGYKRLLNDLASSGLYKEAYKTGNIVGAIDAMSADIVGKPVFLSMWPKKRGEKKVQEVRIVKPKDATASADATPVSKFAV